MLIIPSYSARQRASKKYMLMADGNLMAIMHRFWHELKAGIARLAIPLPEQCDAESLNELYTLGLPNLLPLEYGRSIADTRNEFWHKHGYLLNTGVLWSGIALPPGLKPSSSCTFLYMANVSKQAGIMQPCDAYWQNDLHTLAIAEHCYVQDAGQLHCMIEASPQYANKLTLGYFRHLEQAVFDAIGYDTSILHAWPCDAWLASFKLSDPEHASLFEKLREQYASQVIVFSDPTKLFTPNKKFGKHRIMHINRQQRQALLRSKVPFIWYGHDKIWHPGREEALYFGCKIVRV